MKVEKQWKIKLIQSIHHVDKTICIKKEFLWSKWMSNNQTHVQQKFWGKKYLFTAVKPDEHSNF